MHQFLIPVSPDVPVIQTEDSFPLHSKRYNEGSELVLNCTVTGGNEQRKVPKTSLILVGRTLSPTHAIKDRMEGTVV